MCDRQNFGLDNFSMDSFLHNTCKYTHPVPPNPQNHTIYNCMLTSHQSLEKKLLESRLPA